MWIVSSAVNAVDNLSTARIIPRQLTVDNFVELFTNPLTPFGVWIWNTWKVAIVAALGNVTLAALAAFAFSRLHFRGRRVGLLNLVLVQIFPQFLGFIALFLLGQQIGDVADFVGLNTHGYLILVYLGGAVGFNAFLIKGYRDTVPGSLDESAAVEGASLCAGAAALREQRLLGALGQPVRSRADRCGADRADVPVRAAQIIGRLTRGAVEG